MLALAAGCARPAAEAPTASPPTATRVPPTPSATPPPPPHLLLIGDAPAGLGPSLQGWAAERGWQLREAAEGAALPGPHTAAVVLAGQQGEATLQALIGTNLPIVAVEVAGAAPGERISTVGKPGARLEEAGFLAGVLLGLVTRSGQVGLIEDRAPAQAEQAAYLHGLRYLCVRCTLLALEPEAASLDAFRARGVDAVGVVPGARARAAAESLAGGGLWLVLVDQPSEAFPSGEVAARVVFTPAPLVIRALEALLAGEPGQAWPYALELGGIQPMDVDPQAITPGRRQVLQQTFEALQAGALRIGMEPETAQPTP